MNAGGRSGSGATCEMRGSTSVVPRTSATADRKQSRRQDGGRDPPADAVAGAAADDVRSGASLTRAYQT